MEFEHNGRRYCLDCQPPRVIYSDPEANSGTSRHEPGRPCRKHRDPSRNYDDNGLDIGRRFGANAIPRRSVGRPDEGEATDCGVETPEAAVEAIRRELVVIERIATKRGPAHRLDLANIALMATRARLELDRIAQGWTPPGGK